MNNLDKTNLPVKQRSILNTAEDLFKRFGIKRITIEEICKKAGVSKMTFYKYFKNKKFLVRFMWQNLFDEGLKRFNEIDNMDIPFPDKIELILKFKEETAKNISHEFAMEYFNDLPDMQSFFFEMYSKIIDRFILFIQKAQQQGFVRRDMKPEFFLAAIQKLTELTKDRELIAKYKDNQKFVMEVNNFYFYGIFPRPEKKF